MTKTKAFTVFCGVIGLLIAAGFTGYNSYPVAVKQISIPLAGNAYLTDGPQNEGITGSGIEKWHSASNVYSVFFKLDNAATVEVGLRGRTTSGSSTIQISTASSTQKVNISNTSFEEVAVGTFELNKGYNRIDVSGISKSGDAFAQVSDLLLGVSGKQSVAYVKDNESNHYYWGRRGPSVHLKYAMPSQAKIEWLYSELTVPEDMDPVGSYFMANGFGEGYFGMQVNSPTERRVLFSVWSPFRTDNPDEIPESHRIKLLKKGDGVHAGKFGNEGSGGQSYWKFNWKAGQTYRFLTQIKPDGDGSTVYSSYFYAPELDRWKLIASFSRPQTDTWVSRPHSFLENFADSQGYKTRKGMYGNQWVRDAGGQWHELTEATFTGDNIASIGFRKDYKSGTNHQSFYLQNGGFFDDNMPLGTQLKRKATNQSPRIDFDALPQ